MKKTLIVCVLVALASVSVHASFGIGAKLVGGGIPFVTAEFGGGNLGLEVGLGFNSVGIPGILNFSMLWYSGIGRLFIPSGNFAPYVGIGGMGLTAIVSSDLLGESESATVFGVIGEGGIRYSFQEMGIPLELFAGVGLTWVPSIGLLADIGYQGGGMNWHIGAVVPF